MQREMLNDRIDQIHKRDHCRQIDCDPSAGGSRPGRSPANIQLVAAGSSQISVHLGGVATTAAATGAAASDERVDVRELDDQSQT
jgi:hypothetical protein